MSNESILVVEDERSVRELLLYNLVKAGYRVSAASDGEQALKLLERERPALVILDLMLPDCDGFSLCQEIRARLAGQSAAIVMLTAKGEDSDVVVGLETGADDYVTKPFSPKVLLARIRAVLRRREQAPPESDRTLESGGIYLHPGRREARVEGEPVELTNTEFRILQLLMRKPGWVFSRAQIVDGIFKESYSVTERAVDVQIVGLRRKLKTLGDCVETVRGVGYRFRDV